MEPPRACHDDGGRECRIRRQDVLANLAHTVLVQRALDPKVALNLTVLMDQSANIAVRNRCQFFGGD